MERESSVPLCRAGCGFFSNPSQDGLCSKCYREALKKKQQPPTGTPSSVSVASQSSVNNSVTTAFNNAVAAAAASASTKYMETGMASTNIVAVVSSQTPAQKKDDIDISAVPTSNDQSNSTLDESNNPDDSTNNSNEETTESKLKKKNRCVLCRKKVGLTGFECRCGGLYCGVHRYSDKHNCTFDYRQLGAQEIRRNNPVVVGEKIQKI